MQHASADQHAGQAGGQPGHAGHQAGKGRHYLQLLLMALLSYVAMYWLMYAMVDRFANVFHNLNQAYMAGLMTAPMVLIEMLVMRGMYTDRRLNSWIVAGSLAALIGFFLLIRQQAGINDQQFLRSMIPHHAGAILMCEQAEVEDPQIQDLCEGIIAGQQAEIDLMKEMLNAE